MKYHLYLKGFVGSWDFDLDYVDYILEKFHDQKVDVRIDSTGGSVAAALSIAASFQNHGNVHVHLTGINASAATIASLGAAHISMDAKAVYMIHNASVIVDTFAQLNKDGIQDQIDSLAKTKQTLDIIDTQIAKAYADRCRKDPKCFSEMMAKETWLSPQQALDFGFIDEITSRVEDAAPVLDSITAEAFLNSGIPIPRIPTAGRKPFLQQIHDSVKSILSPILTKMDSPDNKSTQQQAVSDNQADLNLEARYTDLKNQHDELKNQYVELSHKYADIEAKFEEFTNRINAPISSPGRKIIDSAMNDLQKSRYLAELNSAAKLFNSLP